MRPLFFEFPNDPPSLGIDDEFLLGSSVLIVPVTAKGVLQRPVYLPPGLWYDARTLAASYGGRNITAAAPLTSIPVYYRGGSIIVKSERPRRSSSAMADDPLSVYVFVNGQVGDGRGGL